MSHSGRRYLGLVDYLYCHRKDRRDTSRALRSSRASEGQELQVIFSVLLPKDGRIFVNGSIVADPKALEKRSARR